MTKSSFPAWPVWLLIVLFFSLRRFLHSLDMFGWFTKKRTRLQEAIEKDQGKKMNNEDANDGGGGGGDKPLRWYELITPQTFFFLCNSLFLNRTKASLRLGYEPLYDADESRRRSIDWYKNHLKL